jgi:hypothetical protein
VINLKEIVLQLDGPTFESLELKLKKSKGDKFLSLMRAYRENARGDDEIIAELGLNSNAYYVLKSRLYEKIQDHIADDAPVESKNDILDRLRSLAKECYSSPRQISIAHLEKLERDLTRQDMYHELLLVYSILKKMHVRSEKYFHYTQLYNKHMAFLLSVEKSENILSDFNLILSQYLCSKSAALLDRLKFLHREVLHHVKLNPSKQIELIRHILEAEFAIFCSGDDIKIDAEESLVQARKHYAGLSEFSWQKSWDVVLDYLQYEYLRVQNPMKAKQLFTLVNSRRSRLLLYSDVCPAANFFLSKFSFAEISGNELKEELDEQLLSDPHDVYSKVLQGIYRSVLSYSSGQVKAATSALNEVMNEVSFKDFFHINLEIKLTQVYYYLEMGESDLAEGLIKSVYRKIKSEEMTGYDHVLDLIKLFNFRLEDKHPGKHSDQYILFSAKNRGKYAVLQHLIPFMNLKYDVKS